MKSLTEIMNAILSGTVFFVGVYVILMLLGSFVSWENLFDIETPYKAIVCFFDIVFSLFVTIYLLSDESK